ncbi:hypothetical protein FHX15_002376 [Rhizobium sp. BK650]|uniref:hypothetical protein n=1 Tax=Rhizobium sp. BK650 TaxID=2586990 RepID=UPI00161891C9|nr:hypothetical protein [Rhizobium sp. BK650]MBB3657148.1 hypothetical protein [Rhizobium sp. BK650]
MMLRLSLPIRELCGLSGTTIIAHVGWVQSFEDLGSCSDRKDLLARLFEAVFSMAPKKASTKRAG